MSTVQGAASGHLAGEEFAYEDALARRMPRAGAAPAAQAFRGSSGAGEQYDQVGLNPGRWLQASCHYSKIPASPQQRRGCRAHLARPQDHELPFRSASPPRRLLPQPPSPTPLEGDDRPAQKVRSCPRASRFATSQEAVHPLENRTALSEKTAPYPPIWLAVDRRQSRTRYVLWVTFSHPDVELSLRDGGRPLIASANRRPPSSRMSPHLTCFRR